MVERKIIPFPNQDHNRAIADIAFNKTVDRFNLYRQVALWTPKLMIASLVGGFILGWSANHWWNDNKDYLR